jgi:hypothetical protein
MARPSGLIDMLFRAVFFGGQLRQYFGALYRRLPHGFRNCDKRITRHKCQTVYRYRALPQVWCNLKSRNAPEPLEFNEIAIGVLLFKEVDSRKPQTSINLIVFWSICRSNLSGLHQT